MGKGEGSPQGRIRLDDSLEGQGLGLRYEGKVVILGGSGWAWRNIEKTALASLGHEVEGNARLLYSDGRYASTLGKETPD